MLNMVSISACHMYVYIRTYEYMDYRKAVRILPDTYVYIHEACMYISKQGCICYTLQGPSGDCIKCFIRHSMM